MPERGTARFYNSKSRSFLAFCFCFMVGVGVFSFVNNTADWLFYLYVGIFVVLALLIIFWADVRGRFLVICLLLFVLGGARLLWSAPTPTSDNVSFYNGEKTEFESVISSEFSSNTNGVQYIVKVKGVTIGENTKSVHGSVLVTAPVYPDYIFGDRLKVACNLQSPKVRMGSNFRYDRYLARVGIWSVCPSAKITLIARGGKNILEKIVREFVGFRKIIDSKTGDLWPEPEASFMSGILYGARSGLPDDLTTNFNRVGITHIIAISGYNISVVAAVLMMLLLKVGVDRRHVFWAVVAGIILFVLFSGASASVVRAGIMGIIVLLATQVGRASRIGNVLIFTAAVMLLFNPYILIWDAGFQLSFLATLGLVYISPLIESVIARPKAAAIPLYGSVNPFIVIPAKAGIQAIDGFLRFVCNDAIVATLSAIIATLPLILFQFGRLSLIAPVVNVLVLWIVPYLMLFGFLAIIFGFIFFPFGQLIAWVALFGMKYLIFIANWFGEKSWAAIDVAMPAWLMFLSYVLMIYLIIINTKKATFDREDI